MLETIEELQDQLITLELALQRQHSDIDPDSVEHLLRADFFEFGSSGESSTSKW